MQVENISSINKPFIYISGPTLFRTMLAAISIYNYSFSSLQPIAYKMIPQNKLQQHCRTKGRELRSIIFQASNHYYLPPVLHLCYKVLMPTRLTSIISNATRLLRSTYSQSTPVSTSLMPFPNFLVRPIQSTLRIQMSKNASTR